MLARHAKSSWSDLALSDHDRPLNGRGRRAAPLVGAELAALGCVPDVVYSSTAARTRETWSLMEPEFGGHPRVEFLRGLYLASPRMVLATVAATPRKARTVMVLGHNPSTQALAALLSRTGDQDETGRIRTRFPTGAVAVIELAADDWARAEDGGELLHLVLPRRLEGRDRP